MDQELLAKRLAEAVMNMRPASRYAVEQWLNAVDSGFPGASLTLHGPQHDDRLPEATFVLDPRKPD